MDEQTQQTPTHYTVNDRLQIPAMILPSFRTTLANQNGVAHKILVKTWGGLGDEICAEPTLRYILNKFGKDCEISLAAERPELFRHLKFKRVFDLKEEQPLWENYLLFQTIVPPQDILWQFMSHLLTHCVDFTSICAIRTQLPNVDKEIQLHPVIDLDKIASLNIPRRCVVVHAGRHWPSKTFPKDWWDHVLDCLKLDGVTPILIGADTSDNRGTVDVNAEGCVDLRNKLSIMESIWLCQNAPVVLTNDSSPLHMAASGKKTWIGFVATCKHPDYITHWRNGQFGYRMKNFGKGGLWDVDVYNPNSKEEITAEFVDEELLRSWLPHPREIAEWAASKVKEMDSIDEL